MSCVLTLTFLYADDIAEDSNTAGRLQCVIYVFAEYCSKAIGLICR